MPVWGKGNFERDDELNVLDNWIQQIVSQIRETFARNHETTLYEDYGESRIITNIDILCTLLEQYKTYPIVDVDEIDSWEQHYLTAFNRTIHVYNPQSNYVEKRRKEIMKTFMRLKQVIDEFWIE